MLLSSRSAVVRDVHGSTASLTRSATLSTAPTGTSTVRSALWRTKATGLSGAVVSAFLVPVLWLAVLVPLVVALAGIRRTPYGCLVSEVMSLFLRTLGAHTNYPNV